jgi:hypothetical protein
VGLDPVGGDGVNLPAVLGGWLQPLGWSIGFIRAPFPVVLERLIAWRRSLGANLAERQDLPGWPACVEMLEPLEAPWTTELLAAHGSDWTVYLNNSIGGGDPSGATSVVGDSLGVRWVLATHQPMTAVGHAATRFSLGGPEGEPPLHYIRRIEADAEDRRWSWSTFGAALPFERTSAYRARRVRDRFARPLLVGYLAELGIAVDHNSAYGRAALIRQTVPWPTRRETLEEARRAWKID